MSAEAEDTWPLNVGDEAKDAGPEGPAAIAGPFAAGAMGIFDSGLGSPLWLPLPAKGPPDRDRTGAAGTTPSRADVGGDIAERGEGNLAIRLAPTVVGIDEDRYAGKGGVATVAAAEAALGPLPPAPSSTSREDGSRIRYYRVAAGTTLAGSLSAAGYGDGVEVIQHHHRYAVAPPSIHPEGRAYRWVGADGVDLPAGTVPTAEDLPWLPPVWVTGLQRARPGVSDAVLAAQAVWPVAAATHAYVVRVVAGLAADEPRGDWHTWAFTASCRLAAAARLGLLTAADLTAGRAAIVARLTAASSTRGSDEDPGREAARCWDDAVTRASHQTEEQAQSSLQGKATPVDALAPASTTTALHALIAPQATLVAVVPAAAAVAAVRAGVDAVIASARTYQDLPDPGHLVVAMAAAVTRDLDDEPAWVLIVAAPSSGKTETTRAMDKVVNERVDDLTAAGLLSWKTGKAPAPTGILARIGDGARALVTIGDLSTLLASSDRGGRDTTFALLRKVYDGHVVRDLGSAPAALTWSGKVTIVAAVTGVIDHYAAHNDALGPRWCYYRLPERDTDGRRRASKAARRGDLDRHRAALADQVLATVTQARDHVKGITVPDEVADAVEDAALVTCWGRATVPRHGYGRREIDGLPVVEEPMRLVRQLLVLTRGLLALGLSTAQATALARRVALDSMPQARRAVLGALALGEALSTSAVAASAGVHRHVARHQLEELEAIGVVAAERAGAEPAEEEGDRRPVTWSLDTDDGPLIADVVSAGRRDGLRWHEVWAPPTPPPQIDAAGDQGHGDPAHTSCHPTARRSASTGVATPAMHARQPGADDGHAA